VKVFFYFNVIIIERKWYSLHKLQKQH